MHLDEGHWTVFQRRENGYVDFYRGWNEYKTGFGNLNNEFWLGNENLHFLTSQYNYEMRIDLIDFDGNNAFAKYKEFAIGDESSKFKLTANEYYGTAGNSLAHHNGHRFSTKDSDNDNHPNHCATMFPGAWWFNYCVTSDLNGQYFQKTPDSAHRGVYWRSWKGSNYSLKSSLMMMRRVSN
ncbi:ficolin-2-like [Mytilus galloprovincialis]|uniref:ficolin-2-like n=1 Tax=Mytilus galloprovincialis TaxID=29158 RepID=UPI003F7CCA80